MSINLRIATGLSAAALATCGLLAGAAGVGATSAVAAPAGSHHHHHHHCPGKHKGKYPPGKCRIYFTQHTYHKKQNVTLASGHVFKGGEKVTVLLVCPKTKLHPRFVQHEAPIFARHGGSAHAEFFLTKNTPSGTCYVVLYGTHSHVELTGSFRVKK